MIVVIGTTLPTLKPIPSGLIPNCHLHATTERPRLSGDPQPVTPSAASNFVVHWRDAPPTRACLKNIGG